MTPRYRSIARSIASVRNPAQIIAAEAGAANAWSARHREPHGSDGCSPSAGNPTWRMEAIAVTTVVPLSTFEAQVAVDPCASG